MTTRVGLFGGSFNPIHHGHLIVARAMAEQMELDRVIMMPSARPPHKQADSLLDPAHRGEMVRRAIRNDPLFSVSDHDLVRAGPSYTIDTVTHFRSELGDQVELFWMIGQDSLAELLSWRRVRELVDLCRIITANRRGGPPIDWDILAQTFSHEQVESLRAGLLETPVIEISSTEIRGRIKRGQPIAHLVPHPVAEYVDQHRLYKN